MAGIENDGDVGVPRRVGEILDDRPELGVAEIAPKLDPVETCLAEQSGNGDRVIARIGEARRF